MRWERQTVRIGYICFIKTTTIILESISIMNIFEVKIDDYDGAPVATHNMPCAVCYKKHAVLDMGEGIFQPCWDCQKIYKLRKVSICWLKKLFK